MHFQYLFSHFSTWISNCVRDFALANNGTALKMTLAEAISFWLWLWESFWIFRNRTIALFFSVVVSLYFVEQSKVKMQSENLESILTGGITHFSLSSDEHERLCGGWIILSWLHNQREQWKLIALWAMKASKIKVLWNDSMRTVFNRSLWTRHARYARH